MKPCFAPFSSSCKSFTIPIFEGHARKIGFGTEAQIFLVMKCDFAHFKKSMDLRKREESKEIFLARSVVF